VLLIKTSLSYGFVDMIEFNG